MVFQFYDKKGSTLNLKRINRNPSNNRIQKILSVLFWNLLIRRGILKSIGVVLECLVNSYLLKKCDVILKTNPFYDF